MNAHDVSRNVRFYTWYVTFAEPLFWGPVLISSLIHLGKMNLSGIYYLESIVLIGFIFLEIPSGALADLIGRKKTIVAGAMFQLASRIIFACMNSPGDVWTANIMWMIGASLTSGADSAFLYDSLKVSGREDEYRKIEGRATGNYLILVAFCSLAVGFLAGISLRLPALLSIPGAVVSLGATFFLKEPPTEKKYTPKEQIHIMKSGFAFVARSMEVKWIFGFATMISVASKIWFFTYNPYFELVLLDVKYYGVIFFFLNGIAWYFSRNADGLAKKVGEKNIIVLLVALVGIPVFIMGSFVSVFAIGMIFLQNMVRGLSRPFFSEFLNRHIDSKNRATVLSIQSAISGGMQFVSLGAFGFFLTTSGLPLALQVLGGTVLVFGIVGILIYRKIFT